MDKSILEENILKYCNRKGVKPTPAFVEAGVGRAFMQDIRAGKTPSVTKVATLAAYLGCTTSDLVGDASPPTEPDELAELLASTDEETRGAMLTLLRKISAVPESGTGGKPR